MATILVTGGLGYIGSHTVVALQQAGHEVLVIDNLANSSLEVLNRIKSITGKRPKFKQLDMQNDTKLRLFFRKNTHIQGVIHFAAHKSVPDSIENPLVYYQNNVGILVNLSKIMRQHSIQGLVFSSSCSVYGNPTSLPVTENMPFQEVESPYARTKRMCEEILKDVSIAYPSSKIISLRYFNPLGAHDSGKLGEDSTVAPSNLLPLLLQKALGIRTDFHVFGNNYPTPDGTCVRDYIHIEDLAQAHVAAIARILEEKNKRSYEVFNVGTGKGHSVLEVIDSFERVSGIKLSYTMAQRRAGDVAAVYADATHAQKELGWKAHKTLDEMVLSAWHWEQYKQHLRKNAR
jgi:UDP-glucose 4-epimerase